MRSTQQIKNYLSSMFRYLLTCFFSLYTRNLFIQSLGVTYLGVTGLMTNVLGMLAIAELGIGGSIVFSLYKPLARGDQQKVHQLIYLYKKLYAYIGAVVLVLGLLLMPFLNRLSPEFSQIPHSQWIYLMYLANAVLPYYFAYNSTLYTASQQDYKIQNVRTLFYVLTVVSMIVILNLFPDYILLTAFTMLLGVGSQLLIFWLAHRKWPWLSARPSSSLPPEDIRVIKKNVKAIFFHKIGDYCVNGTANIIIASAGALATVGLLANYTVLSSFLKAISTEFFNAMSAGVGNLIAQEDRNHVHGVFMETNFIAFVFFGMAALGFFFCADAVIRVWLGGDFILPASAVVLLSIDFFVMGMRIPPYVFKSGAGQFSNDKYLPLIQACVNLSLGISLVHHFGVSGVLFSMMFSGLVCPSWFRPYVLYRDYFKSSCQRYFVFYACLAALLAGTGALISLLLALYEPQEAWLNMGYRGVVVVLVFALVLCAVHPFLPGGKAAFTRLRGMLGFLRKKISF